MKNHLLLMFSGIFCLFIVSPAVVALSERAINGQFDQVTITYEQYMEEIETQYYSHPPLPSGWSLTEEGESTLYWEPDDWEEEESDLHAVIWLTHDGDQPGASTILDATGGQYVEIILGEAGNEPVGVYLDDVLLGNVSGSGSVEQFNISGDEWSTSSELRFNALGSQWTSSLVRSISLMAEDSPEPPVANFSATPTSGTRPLTVQFTDTSTGSPTSWEWDFNNDGIVDSGDQNPQYTYNEIGSYTIKETVTNSGGNDSITKNGYITVTGYYYIYSDGVSLYHGFEGNSDLARANTTASEFYSHIDGKEGTIYSSYTWEGLSNPVDDATGSRNWNINQDANSMANNADFAFHAGHGWDDGILFGTSNYDYKLFRTNNLSFGGNNGRAKYVALLSCNVLNETTQNNWKSVFNGLHILMGYDTYGREAQYQGSQFADRMTGSDIYDETKIREAWKKMLQFTINDASIKGAYMWANPSGEDYLPGFGSFNEPIKDGYGQYTISWDNFACSV